MMNFSISTIQFMEIENARTHSHYHKLIVVTYRLSIYYAN